MDYQNKYLSKSGYECLLFDVDDTLYPFSSGLSTQCTKNITAYMIEYLGIDATNASEMCLKLYKDYGTTMSGLRAIGYEFDDDHYHRYFSSCAYFSCADYISSNLTVLFMGDYRIRI